MRWIPLYLCSWLFFLACTNQPKEKAQEPAKQDSTRPKEQKQPIKPSKIKPVSKNNCTKNQLEELKGKQAYHNKELANASKNAVVFELSPQQNYLIYNTQDKLKAHNLANDKSFTLVKNLDQGVKFSEMVWNESETILSMVLAESGFPTKMFVLYIANDKVTSSKSFILEEPKYEAKADCPRNIEMDFEFQNSDSLMNYQSTNKLIHNRYLYLHPSTSSNPVNIESLGFTLNNMVFGVVDKNHKEIDLPKNIKEAIAYSFLPPSIIPNTQTILYSDVKSDQSTFVIKSYNIENQETKTLITMLKESQGLSGIIYSPNQTKLAFVDVNQSGYKMGTKLYVLDLETNQTKSFDLPIYFVCGASCYVHADEDFKFKDSITIEYKKHPLKNEGKEEYATIKIK